MANTRQATLDQMDAAAFRARKELEQNLGVWKATDMIEWWDRWYLFAGHKRLGRTLVDLKEAPQVIAEGIVRHFVDVDIRVEPNQEMRGCWRL